MLLKEFDLRCRHDMACGCGIGGSAREEAQHWDHRIFFGQQSEKPIMKCMKIFWAEKYQMRCNNIIGKIHD